MGDSGRMLYHLRMGRAVAMLALALLALPSAAQQRIDYMHRNLDCDWLLTEYRRLKVRQDLQPPDPLGPGYKIMLAIRGVLDVIGGQEKEDLVATVPDQFGVSFSYRAQDFADAMRIKSCASQFGEVSRDITSNEVPSQFRKPQSMLP